MDIVSGVDIGQKRDPTAVCVAEIDERQNGERSEYHFEVRHLEPMPLGTPYPSVADRAGEIVAKVKLKTGSTRRLYVDATGVGKPIVDLLEEKGVKAIGGACREARSGRRGGRRRRGRGRSR